MWSKLHVLNLICHFIIIFTFWDYLRIFRQFFFLYILSQFLFHMIVPIIPEVLMELDRIDDPDKNGNGNISPNLAFPDKNVSDSLSFTKQLLQESYKALDENSQVGLLLSSKALVQILANPCVGCLTERYCCVINDCIMIYCLILLL